ncbi:hypothetical protein [Nocardia jejuensis]|uniref:hypothetical protein n=1 Tax=Nocardia jejuensis TaxID=328049 RepID=UPI000B100C21|nr:hypothetical protein [Nocardia jejuensis]
MSSGSCSTFTQKSTLAGSSGQTYEITGEPGDPHAPHRYPCRDAHGRDRVYARYSQPLGDPEILGWVTQTVRFGRETILPAEQGAPGSAANSINWPIDLILHENALAGVITPVIPATYLHPDGERRTLDQLYTPAPGAPEVGTRVAVLIRICEIFTMLDEWAVVHGDICGQSLLWHSEPPGAYLLDGQSLRPAHAVVAPGPGADGWRDPRAVSGAIIAPDRYSDRYALAVLAHRVLLREDIPVIDADGPRTPPALPMYLPATVRALFERALTDPFATDTRPTPAQWLDTLCTAFLSTDGTDFRHDALDRLDWYTSRFGTRNLQSRRTGAPRASTREPARRTTARHPVPALGHSTGTTPSTTAPAPAQPSAPHPSDPAGSSMPAPGTLAGLAQGRTASLLPGNAQPLTASPPTHHVARIAGIVAIVAVLVAGITLLVFHSRDSGTDAAPVPNPDGTTSAHSGPAQPAIDWSALNTAATDRTPFTADALLPHSFQDAKNVEYTLRAGGVQDCLTGTMSENVKTILDTYRCTNMVSGSYIDRSDQILVSVDVYAFPASATAASFYESMKGQPQDWPIWCPKDGAGASVCDTYTGYATRSAAGSTSYRYVYKSTALYINLTRDTSITEWLDAAARAAADKAGPQNYWPR